jgi:ABC-type uncharacterized transport system permease subunit
MEITSRKTKPGGDGKAVVFCNDNSDCECLAVFVACVFFMMMNEYLVLHVCFHISCNKNWFSSYEYITTIIILLALFLFRSGNMMA